VIGISGSFCVAAFGMRVNTFANSRTSFAALRGKPYPCYDIPLGAGMSIGMLLVSVELLIMLCILLFIPGELAGYCFIGFAIGESPGAAALRVAGGIFTKIADIGSDLMKIVFKIEEDDARNPGVIADCTGDNAGDRWARAPTDSKPTASPASHSSPSFCSRSTIPWCRCNSWSGSSACAS
jgi:K(+)-stimulated pyrophosphate-energized sodium pump